MKKYLILVSVIFVFFISCKNNESEIINQKIVKIDSVSILNDDNIEVKKDSTGLEETDCIVKSNFKLPYNEKVDIKKVTYNNLNCKISGLEEFLCDEKKIRYISLPSFKNINVILVPMDCGDFNYRYFLLTIFKNKLISKQYVEGEWFEPEDNNYKEITDFSIDEDYKISITTNAIENGKTTLKEKLKFEILEDGHLEKAKM